MPFNGSGSFSVSGAPFATGTTIAAGAMNPKLTDLAGGLTNAVTRDGQSPLTADLPMGGFKAVNLANAVASTDAVAYGQLAEVLIARTVISGAPSVVDFALPSGFTSFRIVGTTLYSASGGFQVSFRTSVNGGASYSAGAADYGVAYSFQSNALNAGATNASSIFATEQSPANNPHNFVAFISPGDGAFGLRAWGTGHGTNTAGTAPYTGTFSGSRAATGRATNIRVAGSAAFANSGVITLFGVV